MERLKHIKEKLIETVCNQMDHLESVDAAELGEVVDMIKDIEQIYYYSSVVHAMKEKDEVSTYYYNPILLADEEGMYHLDHKDSHKLTRDPKEGISQTTRKAYLEMKEEHQETDKLIKELEKYLQELSHDILEMAEKSTTEEKAMMQQKLTTLVNKIK